MARFKIIANPVSGRGAGERAIPSISQRLSEFGLDFSLSRTEQPWHAAGLARQAAAEGSEVVVAMGGDGTANEVLNGLMQVKQDGGRTPALGVLSVGRGNDFAFGMGIPPGVEAGCRTLRDGVRRTIDVGRVTGGDFPQGRYFGNGVGIGFDAVVGFEAAKMKRLSGFPSYIAAALKTISLFPNGPRVSLETEEDSLELQALMISIMNGRRMGGGFMMAPEGVPDDGRLDICIAVQASRARILSLIPHFLRGDQASQPEVRSLRAGRVTVTALQGSLPAHADGETLCTSGHRLEVELLPSQLELVCLPEAGKQAAG